jgi:predicted dehydrogenase
MDDRPAWRLGIIGVGKIARDPHLPAIAGNPDFRLAAVSNLLGPAPPGAVEVAAFDRDGVGAS